MRIERLTKEHNVDIKWIHFPLHPDTPAETGRSLEDLFAGRGMDLAAMAAQMRDRMTAEGLPYGTRTMTYNSRLAQELGSWAEEKTPGSPIHMALFKAYFVDAKNISDKQVLIDIAVSVGLPEDEARKVLEDRTHEAAVDADWEKSRQYGVTGVPTFVAKMKGVVGAQPYEALVNLVEQARQD